MSSIEHYAGLWRASAMEKVPYTEDFPEALLVLPEFYDGAVGHGQSKTITTTVNWLTANELVLVVEDDGGGIKSLSRLLSWAAPTSLNNYNRNGHGHKKGMSKFAPDYTTANWQIEYRRKGQNLTTITGPFLGIDTKQEEDEDNVNLHTLMPSGTRTTIHFARSVLGRFDTPSALLAALKEIIQTRFSEKILRSVRFLINIRGLNNDNITMDSHEEGKELHSFRWHVEEGVRNGSIQCLCSDEQHVTNGAEWNLSRFLIKTKGSTSYPLKKEFPVYGARNMQTQRVYIALEDRTIEAAKYHTLIGKPAPHNDDNGSIVFVDFVSTDLTKKPQPSTTKVSMYTEDPIYKAFLTDIKGILTRPVVVAAPTLEPAPPAPAAAPKKAAKLSKIEDALGYKFREINEVVHVKIGDVWRPITDFVLTPRS